MKQSIFFSIIILTGVAIGFFAETLVHATTYAPEDSTMAPTELAATTSTAALASTSTKKSRDIPVRLQIPALNIDANVQQVGLTFKGNMGIPSNFTDVAWYRYGAVPGDVGSAVIDGHVDNGLSLAGVFKHLVDLKAGDDVYVAMASGDRVHFKVRDSEYYDYTSAPTALIFNENDASLLRLITCNGDWVSQDKTYDKRLVVTAVKD